jgi:hypothetical protein
MPVDWLLIKASWYIKLSYNKYINMHQQPRSISRAGRAAAVEKSWIAYYAIVGGCVIVVIITWSL